MTVQDEYVSTVRQAQDTWANVVEAVTDNMPKALPHSASPFGIDPNAAIDQLFDFWEKTLEVQREFAKQLAGVTVSVGERVRTQAESVAAAVHEQGELTKRAVREQAESAQDAARERAAKKYEELTKAELQEQLASRDLPRTGNVEELRQRLIEDDQK